MMYGLIAQPIAIANIGQIHHTAGIHQIDIAIGIAHHQHRQRIDVGQGGNTQIAQPVGFGQFINLARTQAVRKNAHRCAAINLAIANA